MRENAENYMQCFKKVKEGSRERERHRDRETEIERESERQKEIQSPQIGRNRVGGREEERIKIMRVKERNGLIERGNGKEFVFLSFFFILFQSCVAVSSKCVKKLEKEAGISMSIEI